jgi:hypothetical protein
MGWASSVNHPQRVVVEPHRGGPLVVLVLEQSGPWWPGLVPLDLELGLEWGSRSTWYPEGRRASGRAPGALHQEDPRHLLAPGRSLPAPRTRWPVAPSHARFASDASATFAAMTSTPCGRSARPPRLAALTLSPRAARCRPTARPSGPVPRTTWRRACSFRSPSFDQRSESSPPSTP